jgi:glutathione S-transferase
MSDCMKLYHHPRTRSARVRWMLGELGLSARTELEEVDIYGGGGRKPDYLAKHPHGYVPALEEDEGVLVESSAIALHLVDRYGEGKLAPPMGTFERGKYYEWMVYVPATVDPCLETIMMHTLFIPEPLRIPVLVERSKKKWAKIIQPHLSRALANRPWILGEEFSAADVIVASAVAWSRMASVLDDATLIQYLERAAARPAFVEAYS